jgi:DNA topoisomerase III
METRGRSPPVHEFEYNFFGKPAMVRVTSVTGHVFSTDFPARYQNWDAIDPVELFTAPTVHSPEGKGGIVKHLEREARGMDYLVLWLDCDREGENICFEVIKCVQSVMRQPQSYTATGRGGRSAQTIFRARFSAVTPKDIEKAMGCLVEPNESEAKAVDARQELDLKVGVAFSRFQTRYFQSKYGNLDSAVISYGPCQTPTLGFCVDRYDEIQSFKSKPYYCIDLSIEARGRMLSLNCDRGRMFERTACDNLLNQIAQDKELLCSEIKSQESKKGRPQPLNTVALLKIASKNLGIGPQAAMRAAEHLYLSGYLSYPRTGLYFCGVRSHIT